MNKPITDTSKLLELLKYLIANRQTITYTGERGGTVKLNFIPLKLLQDKYKELSDEN